MPWAHAAPTRRDTLDQDFLGPQVDWYGEIVSRVSDGDDTCFVLSRVFDTSGYIGPGGSGMFIACYPGPFEPRRFAPGKVLNVVGNLGAATPRAIGGETLSYPVIAGATIRLMEWRPGGHWPPYFPHAPFHYPYYDPFWRPWPYRAWPY